jgi:hypothetical protein
MRAALKQVELVVTVPWSHPSWTLVDGENMPDSVAQSEGSRQVESWLRFGLAQRRRTALVCHNPALRWDEEHPAIGVDPDVCVLEPRPPYTVEELTSLCTWKPGITPPVIAYEHVSEGTASKDYGDGPSKYASSGTRELWVFDPQHFGPKANGGPWLIQIWERGKSGSFHRTYAGDGPVYSEALGAWLRVSDDGLVLRASDDEAGEALWPTEAEDGDVQRRSALKYQKRARKHKQRAEHEKQRAEQEKQRAEQEKQRAEQEKQRAEQEKQRAEHEKQRAEQELAEKNSALARIAELEALLRSRSTQ